MTTTQKYQHPVRDACPTHAMGPRGAYLSDARAAAQLTLRAVSAATGIALNYIYRLETGHVAEPRPRHLRLLARLYGVEYGELMRLAGHLAGGEETPRGILLPGIENLTPNDRLEINALITVKLRRIRGVGATRDTPPTHAPARVQPLLTLPDRRVVAYIRTERTGVKAVDDQKATLDELAGRHDLRIIRTFVDVNTSGATRDRPGLQRLLRDVDAGRVPALLCADRDRLARDPAVFNEISRRLDAGGVHLLVARQDLVLATAARW
jgi:transcriptional regulator with XRE-family HTH domain